MATLRKSPLGRRRAPERPAPTVLDSGMLSKLLGRTVGFGLILAASAAAAQTAPAQPAPDPAAPPAGGSPTETRATAQAPPDVALPGVDVQAQREGDYLVPDAALGGRFPETLVQDLPQSITIVPQELMREQAAWSLRDALRNVTGISLTAGEGGIQGDALTLRGFNAKNDIFLDGIRDFGSFTRDTFNLQSVEVLEGPSSVMFGRGSTGGVIDQVSKVPLTTPYSNAALTGGTGPFYYQHENNVADDGVPYLFGVPAPVKPNNFYGLAERDFESTDVYIGTLRLDHAFSDSVKLRSTLRYAWYGRESSPTAPAIAGIVTPATDLSTVQVTRGSRARSSEEAILSSVTDVTANFSTWGLKNKLVAGVEVDRETFDINRPTVVGLPNTSLLHPEPFQDGSGVMIVNNNPVDTTGTAFGVYAHRRAEPDGVAEADRRDALGLLLGQPDDLAHQLDPREHGQGVEPAHGAGVEPTVNQTYYFSYGTSFDPSAESLTLTAANVNVDPEKNQSFELGAKWQLFEGKLAVRSSVFLIEKTNARTTDPDTGVVTLDGKQRSRGFEVEFAGRPLPRWNIWAGYTYLDTKVTQSEDVQDGVPVQGKQLVNAPTNTGTLWTTYDVPPDWLFGQEFRVGGGFNYVGNRFANASNTNEVPAYIRGDLTLAWHPLHQVELRMNALNIGDNRFYEGVSGGHVVPGAGRTFLFTGTFTY